MNVSMRKLARITNSTRRTLANRKALNIGEEALREAQKQYGRTNSATYIGTKLIPHRNTEKYKDICERLDKNAASYASRLNYEHYNNILYATNQKTKGLLGDCGECAKIIQRKLVGKGIPSINVVMEVTNKNGETFNHAFNLSNIDKKGIIVASPKSWGANAVVTDLWSNISKKRNEAIEYFTNLFHFNPKEAEVDFKIMPDGDGSLQDICLKHFKISNPYKNPFIF